MQALDNWARIAGTAGMNDVALAASSEAVNVARERVLPSPDATETEKQDRYLNCLESLTRIAADWKTRQPCQGNARGEESLSRGLSRRDSNLVATIISRSPSLLLSMETLKPRSHNPVKPSKFASRVRAGHMALVLTNRPGR